MRASTWRLVHRWSRSAPRRWPIRAFLRAWRASLPVAELVVALDLPSGREALALAARLPALKWVKLGSMLYVREGPALLRELTARGVRVFLDLKWHDIRSGVAAAVEAARGLGAAMATVHCLGGSAMLRAAATAARAGLGRGGVPVPAAPHPGD